MAEHEVLYSCEKCKVFLEVIDSYAYTNDFKKIVDKIKKLHNKEGCDFKQVEICDVCEYNSDDSCESSGDCYLNYSMNFGIVADNMRKEGYQEYKIDSWSSNNVMIDLITYCVDKYYISVDRSIYQNKGRKELKDKELLVKDVLDNIKQSTLFDHLSEPSKADINNSIHKIIESGNVSKLKFNNIEWGEAFRAVEKGRGRCKL